MLVTAAPTWQTPAALDARLLMLRPRLNLKNRWVLVTGASSGLGREIARQLSLRHHAFVLLCARREDRLLALQAELKAAGAGGVEVIPADLSTYEGLEAVKNATRGAHRPFAAVLNAGITHFGDDLEQSPEHLQQLLDLNIRATVHLSRDFVQKQRDVGQQGALLLVSSLAGISPVPFQSAYSGSKAFMHNYGLALGHELKPEKISVTVFAPGGIATEMLEHSGLSRSFSAGDLGIMKASACAKFAIKALLERRPHAVPGPLNRTLAMLFKLAPREFAIARSGAMYRDALRKR